jgi:hypothetical protein
MIQRQAAENAKLKINDQAKRGELYRNHKGHDRANERKIENLRTYGMTAVV